MRRKGRKRNGMETLTAYTDREREIFKTWKEEGEPADLPFDLSVLTKYLGPEFYAFIDDEERGLDTVIEMLLCLNSGFLTRKNRMLNKGFSVRCDKQFWSNLDRKERVKRIKHYLDEHESADISDPWGVPISTEKESGNFRITLETEYAQKLDNLSLRTNVPLSRIINLALRTEVPEADSKSKSKPKAAKKPQVPFGDYISRQKRGLKKI